MVSLDHRRQPATVTSSTGRTVAYDLTAMTEDARASWLAVYELGVRDGWARGYEAAEADAAEVHRRAHAVVQAAARDLPYDALAERRGESDRAERQRATLRERGIA